ncbi:MAG: YdcF family protein [Emcibacteraceae bacterium]|nr:YdcF family protein [Emcibacteraceae bacterium]
MIYLNKFLPMVFSPLGLISALLIFALFTRKKNYTFIALVLFWVSSLPVVSNALLGHLEQGYPVGQVEKIKPHKAAIVLSGMVRNISQSSDIDFEFSDGVDRIIAGIELVKAGKAERLILTRGKLPWSKGKPEGEFLFNFAQKYGISKNKIVLTNNVENTNDEAEAISQILNLTGPVILVTSAFHMPRALTVFERQNIKITPFAVDFRQQEKHIDFLDFVPQASAFQETSLFIREIIGRKYYALRY